MDEASYLERGLKYECVQRYRLVKITIHGYENDEATNAKKKNKKRTVIQKHSRGQCSSQTMFTCDIIDNLTSVYESVYGL